jgi:hypothetical protein
MTKELRESVASAFDALSHWRNEIDTVNERYLHKVLDQTSETARSMGWPDEAISATRQHLMEISKAQTHMIDQIMDGWKDQLSSETAPMAMPRTLSRQMTGTASIFAEPMPQFNPLEPWKFWLQAAELWQRTWLPEPSQRNGRRH